MKYRTAQNTSTNPTGSGTFVHEHINTATEPEDRPPPASMLPSWVINTKGTCTNDVCPDRIEGFSHRHVPGFPIAEHERSEL